MLGQIKKWWDERNFNQKFVILFLTVAFVAVLTYLFSIVTQPDWDVLYNDLAPTDAAAVASHLKGEGIVYRVANEGRTILVPKGMVDDTRLKVAESDIIKQDDVGFEGLEKMPIGLTEDQQKLMRQRMLQGELTRTIKGIKGVKDARITIAEPERSIFTSQDEKPSASVMLILEPGIKIKEEQVKAIKNLVSHAIPRLDSEGVFVTDQNGKSLSEEVTQSGSTIDDLRSNFEKTVERKVKEVLSKIVGSENVTVAVTADMNFDKTTAKIERYIPTTQKEDGTASGILVSEQTMEENYSGQNNKAAGGVPGTASNITNPTYVAGSGANANSSDYGKNNITKNYEVSKEIKDIAYAPGQVERLTVAVAVNKVLTSKEQATIEKLVQTASGADEARGDVITVTGMSFAGIEDIEKKQAELQNQAKMDQILSIIEKFAPIILVVVFGGLILGIFWSLIKRPVSVEQVVTYEEPIYEFPDTPEILEAASMPVIEAKLDPEIERMKNELNTFVMNDPAEAARLLLTYIKE